MLHEIEFEPEATRLAPGEYNIENVGIFKYIINSAGIGFFRRNLYEDDNDEKFSSNVGKLLRIKYNLRFKSKKKSKSRKSKKKSKSRKSKKKSKSKKV